MNQRTSPSRIVSFVLLVIGAAWIGVTLTACNTVKGAGEDVQNLGEAGERAIDGD